MEFDEQAAIDFIRTHLPADRASEISDDEILNVIDMIWDYYEDNGLLDISIDDDDEDEVAIDDLLTSVKRLVAKDRRSPLTAADVETIVAAELEYEATLDEI